MPRSAATHGDLLVPLSVLAAIAIGRFLTH
jgi:hypothetical protein